MAQVWQQDQPGLWRFSTRIAAPILATAVGVLALMAVAMLWVTQRADDVEQSRQVRMVEHDVSASINRLSHELEVVAVWNDAVTHSSHDGLDTSWIDENIGTWLYKIFGHDEIYILNADNLSVYAMRGGVQVSADQFRLIDTEVADLVQRVRTSQAAPADHKQRKSTGRAIYEAALLRVGQRPAAVSVMRIVPHADDGPAAPAGQENLLLGIRFLDGSFLSDLREEDLIEGARFAVEADPHPGEATLALTDSKGDVIGYLHWLPETPGTHILSSLKLAYTLAAAIIVALMIALVRVLWRSTSQLQASQAHAHHLAFHDVLTGQPNRARLMTGLSRLWCRRGGTRLSHPPNSPFSCLILIVSSWSTTLLGTRLAMS